MGSSTRKHSAAVLLGLWLLGLAPLASIASAGADEHKADRRRMVEQVRERGVVDPRVLAAMERVPRHLFVPRAQQGEAYDDKPLAIGWGQTISQPSIVGLMTSLLDVKPGDKVLEIGTGSGYQSAVLSRMGVEVYSIEILEPLGEQARKTLARLGYGNVHLRIGDGYKGWPAEAPFDAILLTAAPPEIPKPLLDQLKRGGKMVVPVGTFFQDLQVLTKHRDGSVEKKSVAAVRFVPMTGQAQERKGGH
ncbi:MAG TPA: protein-L-isoaspartate(D-aspartate) O-methyltransferase [Thermoanaerobaculia bacterium]|nr:protein-L-isoaspartate(D-aspartate) O-methyltransferase [Thermoanaerobaculia bacterium]